MADAESDLLKQKKNNNKNRMMLFTVATWMAYAQCVPTPLAPNNIVKLQRISIVFASVAGGCFSLGHDCDVCACIFRHFLSARTHFVGFDVQTADPEPHFGRIVLFAENNHRIDSHPATSPPFCSFFFSFYLSFFASLWLTSTSNETCSLYRKRNEWSDENCEIDRYFCFVPTTWLHPNYYSLISPRWFPVRLHTHTHTHSIFVIAICERGLQRIWNCAPKQSPRARCMLKLINVWMNKMNKFPAAHTVCFLIDIAITIWSWKLTLTLTHTRTHPHTIPLTLTERTEWKLINFCVRRIASVAIKLT